MRNKFIAFRGLGWTLAILACVAVITPNSVSAQGGYPPDEEARRPIFDAITVGLGINMFHGDLDGNKQENFLLSLATANPDVFVSLERNVGDAVLGIDLGYHRLSGWAPGNPALTFTNNVFTIGANVGRSFDFVSPGFLRPYAGLAALIHAPKLDGLDSREMRSYEILEHGTWQVDFAFPVGIVIQNRIRLGAHFTLTEALDAVQVRNNPNRDHLLHIHIGFRHPFGSSN